MEVNVTIFGALRCEGECVLSCMAVRFEFSCRELSNQGSIGNSLRRDVTGRIRSETDRTCVCVG